MKKTRTIYNSEINLKDWVHDREEIMENASCCKSCKDKCESCAKFYQMCDAYNTNTLDDEKSNLNILLDNEVLALVDVGRWNGRSRGYRFLASNLNSIFNLSEERNRYYCDAYNVRATLTHHDSSHYVMYRKLKSGVSTEQVERLLLKGNYTLTDSQISRYTDSLRPFVANVYGW